MDDKMVTNLISTMDSLGNLKSAADNGFAYDQMLEKSSQEGEALIMAAVDGLVAQTKVIEDIVLALGLETIAFEGSDSLDNPTAVFN